MNFTDSEEYRVLVDEAEMEVFIKLSDNIIGMKLIINSCMLSRFIAKKVNPCGMTELKLII